jgi:hypothetical protein
VLWETAPAEARSVPFLGMIKGAPGDPGGAFWRSPRQLFSMQCRCAFEVEWDCPVLLFLTSAVTFSIFLGLEVG